VRPGMLAHAVPYEPPNSAPPGAAMASRQQ